MMVMSDSVYVTCGAPGAELAGSSGIEVGVDGVAIRPRGLTPITK